MKLQSAKRLMTAIAALSMLAIGQQAAASPVVYETGTGGGWYTTNNDQAMNTVFGNGNWTKSAGFTTALLTDAKFLFLDGGDDNSAQLASFLASNQTLLTNFVANGGRLYINDAPNLGPASFSLGFGVTLNWNNYTDASSTATVTAAGVAAGLTAGGNPTTYTGSYFSHATVSGANLSDLVQGSQGIIFGAEQYGAGFAAFGGATDPIFQSAGGQQLLVNELRYVENAQTVPEPATLGLVGLALCGIAAARRKRA